MSGSRHRRNFKKVKLYPANMDIFIERLRKARALNTDPAILGLDSDSLKKFSFHRIELLTKLLSAFAFISVIN